MIDSNQISHFHTTHSILLIIIIINILFILY